jgi:diguanylate cyclase (GGDEF)-like protein
VGNTLQKVLQGRGDKKRQGFGIRRGLAFFLLVLSYLGLIFELPLKRTPVWFSLCIFTIAFYAVLHILKKEKRSAVEFLFSILIFISGIAQAFAPWAKTACFPFMAGLTAFYGAGTILALLLLTPLLELGSILKNNFRIDDVMFIGFLALAAGIALLVKKSLAGGNRTVPAANPAAAGVPLPSEAIRPFHDEKGVSQYLESMFKPDEEIREVLLVAKNTLFADSVSLFVNAGESLRLRCSTEGPGEIITATGGVIGRSMKERTALVVYDISEKKIEVGYLKKAEISSLVAVPVMDDTFPLGVMTADSGRYHAFTSADCDVLRMFSHQVMRILQRERVYPQIRRENASLQILNKESAKLLSTMDIDVIAKNLMEGARRIAPSEAVFLLARAGEFEILHRTGPYQQEKKTLNVKGTLLDIVVKNRESVYISDVRNNRSPLMPFKAHNAGSVFVLPLVYERDVLGLVVLMFEKTNILGTHEIELLEVLGNQAATSIANAKLYGEIERLAVTDGLTGLFNHRHFQEKLAQEFNRLERFSEPISLLIIDIDHFKKINDTYGHPVGDAVLKKVSGVIRKTIRNIDIPARYGGEEFAVILLGTDTGGALKMAERLRKSIADAKFSSEQNAFNVTVSIGISTHTKDMKKKEDLVEQADKALYHAKGTGRNRSVKWEEMKDQKVKEFDL